VDDDAPERIERIADSILDGHPIDWPSIEPALNDSDRTLLVRLRVVAAVARVHRTIAGRVRFPRTSPLLSLPAKWGPLDVVEHIGAGAFADVYRATDPHLDREVALKLLYDDDLSPENHSSVIAEGRLLARVRHPNVVTIHGADRINGRVGLWMEFVRGRTLEQLLGERGAFAPRDTLRVGLDLCLALSAVHGAGVLHRDVKAQNVIREENGRVVLMDFGTGHESAAAAAGATLSGTPLYLAPELFRGHGASVQSDIYSLAVLLFHLVTSAYPIPGRSLAEIRAAHREGRRVYLRDLRPDLSDGFIAAIETALAPDLGTRFQTTLHMARALEFELRALDAAAVHPTDPVRTEAAVDHHPSIRHRWWWLAYITFTAIVGVLAIAPGLLRRDDRGRMAPSAFAAAATGLAKQLAAHRLKVPLNTFVGRPSPDGRYLTYVDLSGNLCLQDLATDQSRCVTDNRASSEGAGSEIAVSADGHTIAYTWHTSDGGNEIRVVDEDGSSQRLLFRKSDVIFPNPVQWSEDGTQVLAMLELAGGGDQLALVSVATGAVKVVKTLDPGQYHAALSPDAAFIAFDQPQGRDTGSRDIFIMSTDSAAPQPVVAHAANDLFPLWTADGRLLFVSDRTGSLALWGLRMADGQPVGAPELVARDIGRLAGAPGLTTSGALFYRLQNGMVDVYVRPLHSDYTPSDAASPVSPTLIGVNISSEWSPDGSRLAYVAMRGLVQNDRYSRVLVVRDIENGRERELRPPLFSFIAPRWAPDGHQILVRGIDARNREGLFVIDLASARTREAILFPGEGVYPANFQWSPDGAAVWYDNSSVGAIVARDLVSGGEQVIINYRKESIPRLTQFPGFRISHDGKSIAYTGTIFTKDKAETVVIARTLGGTPQEITRATSPERVEFQDWTADDSGLLVIKRNVKDRTNVLCEARLDGSPMRPLDISAVAIGNVNLRHDGKAITYTAGMASTEIWVMENFLSSAAPVTAKN
jgi:Tol biopolymer transport system component